jgi:hypothetical protein
MPPICFRTLTKIHRKYAGYLGISTLFYRRSNPILGGAKVTCHYRQCVNIEYQVTCAVCVYLTIHTNTQICIYIYISDINRIILFQYHILFIGIQFYYQFYMAMKPDPNKHKLPTVLSLCAEEKKKTLTSSFQHNLYSLLSCLFY